MTKRDAILNFLAQHKSAWIAQFGISNLGLFGSFAQNTDAADSDIDILVSFQQHTNDIRLKKQLIRKAVEQEFGRSVDVCNEKYIKPFFREAILEKAIYV